MGLHIDFILDSQYICQISVTKIRGYINRALPNFMCHYFSSFLSSSAIYIMVIYAYRLLHVVWKQWWDKIGIWWTKLYEQSSRYLLLVLFLLLC